MSPLIETISILSAILTLFYGVCYQDRQVVALNKKDKNKQLKAKALKR